MTYCEGCYQYYPKDLLDKVKTNTANTASKPEPARQPEVSKPTSKTCSKCNAVCYDMAKKFCPKCYQNFPADSSKAASPPKQEVKPVS